MTRAAVDDPSDSRTEQPVEEPTEHERRRTLPAAGRRPRVPGRVVFFVAFAAAVAGLLAWLLSWWSPVPIRAVTVTGATGDTRDAILAAAGITTGTPLKELDTAAIEQRVGALPGIDTVRLEIERPWTVVIDVLERFPFAVVAKGDQWTVIDATGAGINDQDRKPPGLPVVAEVPDRTPVLSALQALPAHLREKIQKGTIDKAGDVVLTMKSGVEILWGLPGDDDATKAQAVAVLLQYKPEKVDVSVPERPALSGELSLPKQNTAPSEGP